MRLKVCLALFSIALLAGCEKPSYYGEYSNYSKKAEGFREVSLMEPDFFTYARSAQRAGKIYPRFKKQGKFIESEDFLFLPTVSENSGLRIYFTDPKFEQIQIGTEEWREVLHRVE